MMSAQGVFLGAGPASPSNGFVGRNGLDRLAGGVCCGPVTVSTATWEAGAVGSGGKAVREPGLPPAGGAVGVPWRDGGGAVAVAVEVPHGEFADGPNGLAVGAAEAAAVFTTPLGAALRVTGSAFAADASAFIPSVAAGLRTGISSSAGSGAGFARNGSRSAAT